MSWRIQSKNKVSKGSVSKRASSLADLHRRRDETQGQFFTPEWVSKGIWSAFDGVSRRSRGVMSTVFDPCVGAGALFEGADCKQHMFYGVDIDGECIDVLSADAEEGKVYYDFQCGSMADVSAKGFDFAVLNPPFSITLQSPSLVPYECTSFGRYGPCSSALSHEYALEMAMDSASFVAALLPVSMDSICRNNRRLQYVVSLPECSFKGEGANVKTAVYLFGRHPESDPVTVSVREGDLWPSVKGVVVGGARSERLSVKGIDISEPMITLPVTGDKRVELHHHNRRIVLKYHCGLIQARVENALLVGEAVGKRLPKEISYRGDGRLLLDVLLIQDNPYEAFDTLLKVIFDHGGVARVSRTLEGFFKKLVKRHQRAVVPMYRVVQTNGCDTLQAKARRAMLLDPQDFNSAAVQKGAVLDCRLDNGEYVVSLDGQQARLRTDVFNTRYEAIGSSEGAPEWVVQHEGLEGAFPELGRQWRTLIAKKGIDKWLHEFQVFSLVEGLINPYGYIGGWEQGSGKARYALALALMHSGNSMIVLNSGLIAEMMIEIREKVGLSDDLWRVLGKGDAISTKISIVSYATLRDNKKWRRQVNTLICDEGGVLSKINTKQTRGVRNMSARRVIVLDGTVISNYPRDVLPISVTTAGNSVAHQQYGVKGKAYLERRMMVSASHCQRGEDAFFDNHVVTQWVTNNFREDLTTGGKREVPKIDNVALFRSWVAPNIQRRLRCEPDLADFNNCPKPIIHEHTFDWDKDHLAYYLKVAVDFAQWYERQKNDHSRSLNLIAVLARIGAVRRAANSPHVDNESSMGIYSPITSKQHAVVDLAKQYAEQGRKFIVYADSPDVIDRFHNMMGNEGIETVRFTGKQNIKARNKELHERFRYGDALGLLSTWVGQRGLNLEQAKAIISYERSWSHTVEQQALFRTQRPSQTDQVEAHYFHLKGSIDEYCAQMVLWKGRAAAAGLDFGEQIEEDSEFMHLDTLLAQFCNDIYDMSPHRIKDLLCA